MGWGEFFALSSALSWALAVILLRRSGESLGAFELNLFKNCFGLVLMVPTILLFIGCILIVGAYTDTESFAVEFEFEDEEDETNDGHGLFSNNVSNDIPTIDDESGVSVFPLKPNKT